MEVTVASGIEAFKKLGRKLKKNIAYAVCEWFIIALTSQANCERVLSRDKASCGVLLDNQFYHSTYS